MKQTVDTILHAFKSRPAFVPGAMAILLFILVFSLFSPSLRCGLVDLDDLSYISSNPLVMEGFSAIRVRTAFTSFQQGMYAPLLWLSYGLDAVLWNASPANPWGFHFTNALLHALNAVLLFFLLAAIGRKPGRAFFFAALWALHPLRVESVAWVTERKDVLAGFFGLLCLGAYLCAWRRRTSDRPRLSWTFAALSLFSLGLLVKPSLVPIPGALLLLDLWPLRRMELVPRSILRAASRLLAEKIPFFILAVLVAHAATAAHRTIHGLMDVPLATRLSAIPVHYVFYLWKTFVPRHLSPLYPDFSPSFLLAGLALLLLLALMAAAWQARGRHPEWLVGGLFFLGFLAPAIGLVRFGIQSIADRFTYLPAIGISIALLFAWPTGRSRHGWPRVVRTVAALGLLALCAHATLRLLPAWKSPSALSSHVLAVFPESPTAIEMRSFQRMYSAGRFEEANVGFDRIIRSGRFNRNVIAGKARCLAELQGPAVAKSFLLQAPGTDNPYDHHARAWNLARYSLMLRQYDEAMRHAQRALQLPTEDPAAPLFLHLLLMTAAYEKGDAALALAQARQFPAYADKTSMELADLFPYYVHQWVEFHRTDAYAFFQRLTQAYPDRTGLLNNIAWGLSTANWSPAPPTEVLALARQVCAAFPKPNPGALDTLAAAQANAGDFADAVQTLQQALDLLASDSSSQALALHERLLARQALYRRGEPYREEAFSRLMATQFGKGLPVTNRKSAP